MSKFSDFFSPFHLLRRLPWGPAYLPFGAPFLVSGNVVVRPPDKTCQGHGKPWKTSVKPGNFEHSIPGTGMISKFVLKQLEIIVNPPRKSKSFHEDGWWYNLPTRMWKDSQEKLKQWWTEPRAPRPAGAPHHQARFVATRWWSVVGLYLTTTGLYSRYNITMEVS